MEKKNQIRPHFKVQEPTRPNWDYSGKKNGEKFDCGKKLPLYRSNRNSQRCARPREKVEQKKEYSEVGSVQKSGSKKQNITQLLNWWDAGPQAHRHISSENQYGIRNKQPNKAFQFKYNKEHFLQANCQFVVPAKCDLFTYEHDPDRLIEWDLVEEVRLHSFEDSACPICLHPPVAAKITKCGHIFCFACVLHYLALTDKKWQKCPICYDAITKANLKSVVTVVHKSIRPGEEMELVLMRRERESNTPTPVSAYCESFVKPVFLSSLEFSTSVHSKFILASDNEINDYILKREFDELECQFALEGDQPEACFISEALEIVGTRKSILCSNIKDDLILDTANFSEGDVANFRGLASEDQLPFAVSAKSVDQKRESDLVYKSDSQDIFPMDMEVIKSRTSKKNSNGHYDGSKSTYYFFQESSGRHLYLHPLSVRILIQEYGSLEQCPLSIKGKVLEKESCTVTDAVRHRLRYLRHLPIACPFELVEIEVKPPLVSVFSLMHFQDQLREREKKRKKKARQEHNIEKRVQREEDRLLGRSRGSSINMTSFQHFPSFNTEEVGGAAVISSSVEDDVLSSSVSSSEPMQNVPSFAQMIRCGKKKITNSTPACYKESYHPKQQKEDDDDFDSDGAERVPDFGAAFSDAFARALDLAAEKVANHGSENSSTDQKGRKGKKKKKKGIVLLSSGGH